MVELDDADGEHREDVADGEHRGGKQREDKHLDREHRDDGHLDDVADGCGCTEVWEHLSDRRTEE